MATHTPTWFVLRLLVVAFLAAVLAPASASAQGGGIRAGVSANPDQFFFGGHLDFGPLAENLNFRPNVEAGLGGDVTTVAVNVEFAYVFHRRPRPWQAYLGGGPALVMFTRDGGGARDGRSDVGPGFNLLVGLAHARGFFTEVKLGLIDSPEVKFVLGVNFR